MTESATSDASTAPVYLFRQLMAADRSRTFEELRELAPGEEEAIRAAEAVFDGLGASWRWNLLIYAMRAFAGQHESARVAMNAAQASAPNPAHTQAIADAFAEVASALARWLDHPTPEGVAASDEVSNQAQALSTAAATEACLKIGKRLENESIALSLELFDGELRVGLPEALVVAELHASDVPSLFRRVIRENERLAATVLLARADTLLEAGRTLLRYTAEVVYGRATVMERLDPSEQLNFSPYVLGVHKIPAAMAAVESAKRLLAPPAAPTAPADTAATTGATADSTQITAEGEPASSVDEVPAANETGPVVAEVAGLVSEVTSLLSETEERWSAGLADALAADNRRLFERYGSLLSAVYRRSVVRTGLLASRNFDATLPGYPLTEELLAVLFDDSASEQGAVTVSLVAEVVALMRLVDALKGLREPTAMRISLPSGETSSWWEGGAFAAARDAAHLVQRIAHAVSSIDEVASPSGAAPGRWLEPLNLALRCSAHGLPEAAVVYVLMTLGQMESDEVATNLWRELRDENSSSHSALVSLGEGLVGGTDVGLVEAVVLGDYWTDKLRRAAARYLEFASAVDVPSDADLEAPDSTHAGEASGS